MKFPKPSRSERRRAKEGKRYAERESRVRLRLDAVARSRGRCENPDCGADLIIAGCVMDHWMGGSGRRRQEERLGTVWMLCLACNDDRTANRPSAEVWNERFARHAERYSYAPVRHYDARAASALTGSRPGPTVPGDDAV